MIGPVTIPYPGPAADGPEPGPDGSGSEAISPEPAAFGPGPEPSGPEPVETDPPDRGGSRATRVSVVLGVSIAALGVPIGWLWAEVSPRVLAVRTDRGFAYADPAPEQAVAADGWFALLGLAAGLLVAAVAWVVLRRHRGVAVLVAITVGSAGAAYLAWWVGTTIGEHEFEAVRNVAIGAQVQAPLELRMTNLDADEWWRPFVTGVAAAQPLMAALTYTMCAAFSTLPDLRPPPPWPPPTSNQPSLGPANPSPPLEQ